MIASISTSLDRSGVDDHTASRRAGALAADG